MRFKRSVNSMDKRYAANTYYLVRHGEAANNLLAIVNSGGSLREYPLTELGRRQAIAAGEFLSGHQPDFIVSSPILRAKETAEVIKARLNLDMTLDKRLCEPRFGIFEDQSYQSFADYVKTHGGREHDLPQVGVEGYVSVRHRVESFLEAVVGQFVGKKIVIVSHGDTLQQMYGELMGLGSLDAEHNDHWYPKRGSVTVLGVDGETETFVPSVDQI